jgi:hypothetical protein
VDWYQNQVLQHASFHSRFIPIPDNDDDLFAFLQEEEQEQLQQDTAEVVGVDDTYPGEFTDPSHFSLFQSIPIYDRLSDLEVLQTIDEDRNRQLRQFLSTIITNGNDGDRGGRLLPQVLHPIQ